MNTHKIYTYTDYSGGKVYDTYSEKYLGKVNGYDRWESTSSHVYSDIKETSSGLLDSYGYDISYPIRLGKQWKVYNDTCKIIGVNKTVKTPAGTFKNVVVVDIVDESGNNGISYYAPGNGLIRYDANGVLLSQVTKITNR
jgi:hypothetical protein